MTTLVDLPAVLTVEEAGKLLRIGRSAAYDAARRGDLPVIRVERTLRVPRHSLEQMLGIPLDDEPAGDGLVGATLADHGGSNGCGPS